MKHKWEKQADQNWPGIGNIKVWLCKVCKCKKTLAYYKFAEPQYSRSSQNFDHYVECFDIDIENSKTID